MGIGWQSRFLLHRGSESATRQTEIPLALQSKRCLVRNQLLWGCTRWIAARKKVTEEGGSAAQVGAG